jgi:cell division protein FtsB
VSRLPHLPFTPLIIGAAALLITYLGFTTTQYVLHDRDLRRQETQLHAEIEQLDRDHDNLVAVRDYLKSDEYIEDVARRVLGLVRPGETLVIVSGNAPAGDAPPAPEPALTPGSEWWKDLFLRPDATPTPR